MASRRSRERANARPWEQEPDEPQRGLAGAPLRDARV